MSEELPTLFTNPPEIKKSFSKDAAIVLHCGDTRSFLKTLPENTAKFAEQMSTGVSYFEQFVWDLEERGVADIDIPVLIVGINA